MMHRILISLIVLAFAFSSTGLAWTGQPPHLPQLPTGTAHRYTPANVSEAANKILTNEEIYLDTRVSQNPVAGTKTLQIDVPYIVQVSGTWSAWYATLWSSWCGQPDDGPTIPSPGIQNGKVGVDAAYVFAAPASKAPCGAPGGPPWPNQRLEISLDGGATWLYGTPIDVNYRPDHKYKYAVTGRGFPARFRLVDYPNSDNYGILRIEVTEKYSVSGRVTDGANQPLSAVTVSASADGNTTSTTTDSNGAYTITGLAAGTYTLTPSKSGYSFTPASRTVTVPPDATGQDFVGQAAVTSLVYTGAQFLTPAEVIDETDARISTGDHVHLSLPFTNNGNTPIANATFQVVGAPHSGSTAGIEAYDGSAWQINPASASLSLGTINPGETRWLDFWIYVVDSDPTLRQSLSGQTWIEVQSLTGSWRIGINLSPISFSDTVIGNDDMEVGSCLHNPQNPSIQQYAQYAAGACVKTDRTSVSEVCKPRTPPEQAGDPDTPEQAVRNLVDRVNAEFHYKELYFMRLLDTRLLRSRGRDVGVCRHYADLTTGLLRSLHLPTRIISALLKVTGSTTSVGHFWTEAYIGSSEPFWKQADSTSNKAIDQQNTYEAAGYKVQEAWADQYPLASASPWVNKQYRCIAPCYQSPVDCAKCQQESNANKRWPVFPNLTCVADVQPCYHGAGCSTALTSLTAVGLPASAGGLLVNLESPTSVTHGVPFVISTGVTNDTLTQLSAITTTIALREYVDSIEALFEVAPAYQVLNNVGAGETITVTWTITPLVTGRGIPLRFSAESGDLFEFTEQPLVVNEPSTLPDLSLAGVCGIGNASPGQEVTLTASILDENLQAFSDPATAVTATVVATPTLQFSTTLTLPYCESCEAYRGAFTLPDTAPVGEYVVDFEAEHPSYDPAYATSGFFVISQLTVALSTDQSVVGVLDTITVTAQVLDRDATVSGAAVSAEIITPGGTVTVPLSYDSTDETYKLALHPADLAGNLGGKVLAGAWQIQANATYQGGIGSDDGSFTVTGTYPLSEVIISKLETGAELTWPHMGSGVDHYEVYRSTTPYFSPGGTDSVKLDPDVAPALAAGDELSFTDSDAFAEPGTSYFYVVQPVDANGQFYPKSNRTGVFSFALTPGTSP